MPNTWTDREKTYNDLMRIMGKMVQCQLLAGRAGGADWSQAEPGCVQDERVQNENLDDGVVPDKEMGESGGGWVGNGIEQCDGDGEGGVGGRGDGDDDSMDDDEHDDEVLEDNRSEPEEEEEEEQQDLSQEDHVEVTDLLHLLNRSVTPPLPSDSD